MSSSHAIDAAISEADYQDLIADYARMRGWKVTHFRPARTNQGWRTAVSYDGHGFPDLTCARRGHVVFLEVKSARGQMRDGQQEWLDALPNAHLVRPADWPAVQALLR